MQKRTVSVTNEAQADLEEIQAYLLANTSVANTSQVMAWIEKTIESLREGAEKYAQVDRDGLVENMHGIRVFTYNPLTGKRSKPTRWIVFFQFDADTVGVTGVRHTRQRPIWEE